MAADLGALRDAAIPLQTAMGSAVLGFAGSLRAEQWDGPTNCPPWTVKTIFSHLVRNAEMFQLMLDSGQRGERVFPQTQDQREVRQRELAALSVDALTSTFAQGHEALRDRLAGLSADELSMPCPHPRWLMPASWILTQRLVELSCHFWDMESSVGRPAEIDGDVARYILPAIVGTNLPMFYQRDKAASGRWAIVATDLPDGTWIVEAAEGSVSVRQARDAAPVEILADSPALVRWLYGRASAAGLQSEGRMRVAGDGTLLHRWDEAFRAP
jgi:uncharacterized protein (TIGR03083 family)